MIDNNKEIVLTESAKSRLSALHKEIDSRIADYIKNRKNVPGDEFIEVTASDIDEVSNRIKIVRPSINSIKTTFLLTYSIIGALLSLVGLFLEPIKALMNSEHKEQLYLVAAGVTMSITSFTAYFMHKLKERRDNQLLELEKESRRYEDLYKRMK